MAASAALAFVVLIGVVSPAFAQNPQAAAGVFGFSEEDFKGMDPPDSALHLRPAFELREILAPTEQAAHVRKFAA